MVQVPMDILSFLVTLDGGIDLPKPPVQVVLEEGLSCHSLLSCSGKQKKECHCPA